MKTLFALIAVLVLSLTIAAPVHADLTGDMSLIDQERAVLYSHLVVPNPPNSTDWTCDDDAIYNIQTVCRRILTYHSTSNSMAMYGDAMNLAAKIHARNQSDAIVYYDDFTNDAYNVELGM